MMETSTGWKPTYDLKQRLDMTGLGAAVCECENDNCAMPLPDEAWGYVVNGQSVLAPGHRDGGNGEVVMFVGFDVQHYEEGW